MSPTLKLLFVAALCAATTTFAQTQTAKPDRPPDLSLTAVGRHHHPIDTKNKSAQDYFDQGLTFIYGFNHEEAARAFQQAAKLDPASPMPLWGVAMAIGPNYNLDVDPDREKQANETMQKAAKLAESSSPVEKDYVAALSTRFSGEANPDYKKLALNYSAAMKSLSEKYPDDLDAATLYAESLMDLNPWKLWSLDGKPAENTELIIATLESVLARDPNHVGANHFYIHAVEASPHPERALPSAHRLDNMVPQAGHLVHMPAHIYARTGYYVEAAKNNVEAAKVDRVYARKADQEGSMYDLMYHSHNEHFLASAASMAGRYGEAKAAADGLATRLMPHAKTMPMLDTFIMTPLWVDARFNKWDAILARPEPFKELPGTHAIWRYTRTLAFIAERRKRKSRDRTRRIRQRKRRLSCRRPHRRIQLRQSCPGNGRSHPRRPHRRQPRRQGSQHQALDRSRGNTRHPELRRTTRLVLPGTGIAGRRIAQRRKAHGSRRRLPRRSPP